MTEDKDIKTLLAAYQATRPRHDEGQGQPIADVAQLERYLAGRGVATTAIPGGLRAADPPIVIEWEKEHRQVRFRSQLAIDVPPPRRVAVGAVVARANAVAGRAVWRTEPEVYAEIVAPIAGDGSLSSGEVDDAIAALRASLARDIEALQAAIRG